LAGTSFEGFTQGLLDAGIARIPPENPTPTLPYCGTAGDHIELIDHTRQVLKALGQTQQIQNVSVPGLFHPDLHKRNIFVDLADPTKITALIDWQAASLDPNSFLALAILLTCAPLLNPSKMSLTTLRTVDENMDKEMAKQLWPFDI